MKKIVLLVMLGLVNLVSSEGAYARCTPGDPYEQENCPIPRYRYELVQKDGALAFVCWDVFNMREVPDDLCRK